jgi:2-iminobutanoate/2-iminopropanoate deaminase
VKQAIHPSGTPRPVGPYSPAVAIDGLLFCSGQGPMDPETGQIVGEGIGEQTEQTLRNLGALLEGAGLGYADVVKTTCFLRDMDDFRAFNEVYGRFFPQPFPARTTVQAARLPLDIAVEIEAIAVRDAQPPR